MRIAIFIVLVYNIYKTDRLNVRSFKVYGDGALGSRGAAMKESYSDRHNHFGALIFPPERYAEIAKQIAASEFQMNTHAIGDSANYWVLKVYQDALQSVNAKDRRWRNEHSQIVDMNDFELFENVIPSIQPTHTTSFSQDDTEVKLMVYVEYEAKKPVPGAVILINGVRQKMLTNRNGYFRVKSNEAPKTISAFSPVIGIKKVKYTGQSKVVIKLAKQKEYQVVNDVNRKTLDPVQFRNIYDYLRGRIPGVDVSTSNEITIRGFNTVNGSTTPLFIVNGTQVSQDFFGNIVPMQIIKIQVLKGPDAAAYGSRGANGVIVVETN